MLSSRTKYLYKCLEELGFKNSIKALDLVVKEMGSDKGFSRHDGSNYYHHLVDVTQMLINFNVINEDIITAALLHDYVEDVEGATVDFVAREFNNTVATYVDLVTKKKGLNYKDAVVMNDYLSNILASEGASLIKTADRVHNFGNMRESTSVAHMKKQRNETLNMFIPFFKECRNKHTNYQAFFFYAKTSVEPIIYLISLL